MERWSVSSAPGPRLSAGPAVAPELAVRSRPRSVGAPLCLMRSGCGTTPCAPAARSHSPSNTLRTRSKSHDLAGPRGPAGTHRRAQHRLAGRSPERSQRAWAGRTLLAPPARGPGPCPPLAGIPALGWRGASDPFSPFLPQLVGLLCFPFASRRVHSSHLSPQHSARLNSCLSPGSLSLFFFPNPAPFLVAIWFPRKSCFPKFAEVVSKSPEGWLETGWGVRAGRCERAIDPGARAG